jgi:hypothetical protein
MSPEVLIYIQKIKNYMDTNEDANKYFLSGINSDDFYVQIREISENNFKKNGDPMLSREQFENIRELLKTTPEKNKEEKIFFELNGFGKICLN